MPITTLRDNRKVTPFKGYVGGTSRRISSVPRPPRSRADSSGYTPEQRQELKESARARHQRRIEELGQKREELRSAEKVASIAARGGIERARALGEGQLNVQKFMSSEEKASPKYRTGERELKLSQYDTSTLGTATPFVSYFETETGEKVPVMSSSAQKIIDKYKEDYLEDPESALENVQSELAQHKESLDLKRQEIDEWLSSPTTKTNITAEDLDVMEGYGDAAEAKIDEVYRMMEASEAAKISEALGGKKSLLGSLYERLITPSEKATPYTNPRDYLKKD